MLFVNEKSFNGVLVVALLMSATVSVVQGEQPARIPPQTIRSAVGECPSDEIRLNTRNVLQNATYEIIKNFLDNKPDVNSESLVNEVCGPGNWRRVFHVNASMPDESCPGQWNLITSPVRACTGAGGSCLSAFSDSIDTPYSRVCGRIIGDATGSPDAFDMHDFANENNLEAVYLDGLSVTFGAAGSRTHIWTFGVGFSGRCPCDIPTGWPYEPPGPPEVGNNYFCGRDDPLRHLWTGENCDTGNPCCSFHNPPYFSVELPSTTTEQIELRICYDETNSNEQVMALFAEIYVQ